MPPDPSGAAGTGPRAEVAAGRRMGSPVHLVRRFAGMLVPIGPGAADRAWAQEHLLDDEAALFDRMKAADRRHAVGVARRSDEALGPRATRPVLAAALLHDVGKIESHLGVYGRTVATLSAMAVRGDPESIRTWTRMKGFTRRVGLYLQHPKLGGDLLALAGSDPLTEAWAREHHLPPERWSVPADLGRVLKDCDDD